VTIGFGIRNVENTADACREMARVLKPGGTIAILEFAIPPTPIVRAAYLAYFNHVLPRIGESDPASGYMMEALMAAIAQGDPEAKARMQAFLDKRGPKVVRS